MIIPKRFIFVTLILLSLLLAVGIQGPTAASARGKQVPLRGKFSGIGDNFSGRLTHLGRFEGVIDNTSTPPTAIWTAANGDTVTNKTLTFDIHFDQPVAPDVYRYTQTLEFTGGSGRFSQVTGQAIVTGNINVATFAYDGELEGNIARVDQDF